MGDVISDLSSNLFGEGTWWGGESVLSALLDVVQQIGNTIADIFG